MTADGRLISLADWIYTEEWSTAVIRQATTITHPIELFSYGRSQQVPGDTRCATATDTSLHRSGHSGLPQDYEALVLGWRAVVLAPDRVLKSDALAAWMAEVNMEFLYQHKVRWKTQLSELVKIPPTVQPSTGVNPNELDPIESLAIRMQQNLPFGVRLDLQRVVPAQALAMTLRAAGVNLTVRVYLSGFWKKPIA